MSMSSGQKGDNLIQLSGLQGLQSDTNIQIREITHSAVEFPQTN